VRREAGVREESEMKLGGKRVLVIGERDGVNAAAIEACVRSVGAEVIYAETLCFV
jgi:betaine reductase